MKNELINVKEKEIGMVIDSREVANMCEKEHKELMKSIRKYINVFNEGKIHPVDFFIESTYIDSKNETRPCYLLTRKGCDMVANKMTGAKGIVFTARYVTKFEEMERQLSQPKLPTTYKEALLALVEEVEKNEKLELENKQQKQIIMEYEPKVSYYDTILNAKGTMTITQIAKDYGMTACEMNKKLHELGIQYKQSETWLLYSKYAKFGYTQSKPHMYENKDGEKCTKLNTKWTQKGRLFLYEGLKKNGVIPLIEKDN